MPKLRTSWFRSTLATAFVALPFVLAGAAAHADEPLPRLVSVSGEGEVKAQPDMAYVSLGVEARKPSLAEARTEVNQAVERLLALTRELKIESKYVDSTQLQVQPEYRWNDKDSKRVLLGYYVSRQIAVEVHDLERLGPLLERAVTAGANQVGSARLDSSRRKELEREALQKAVEDARSDAEVLARAAGVQLGSVYSLSASSAPPPMPMYRAKMAMDVTAASGEAPESYEASEMKFSAQVSAQYELAPQGTIKR